MSKHTKGDWKVEPNSFGELAVFRGERCICYGFSNDSDESISLDEAEANAHLTAAAPKLLKALRRLEKRFHSKFTSEEAALVSEAITEAVR
jgi:hypothetical protein